MITTQRIYWHSAYRKMSAPSTFNPQHPQPFTLEQAMLLEVNMLVTGTFFLYLRLLSILLLTLPPKRSIVLFKFPRQPISGMPRMS